MSLTLSSKKFPALSGVHLGSGVVNGMAHVARPSTVVGGPSDPMEFDWEGWRIGVLSLETGEAAAPNWFGVSFRAGIRAFDTVNIFCHPHPGNAGMKQEDYATRAGAWPRLFRYAEMFGKQMAIAKSNVITIVPFFTDGTYGSLGIFADSWLDIVEQSIEQVRMAAAAMPAETPATPATNASGRTAATREPDQTGLVTHDATRKKGAGPRTTSGTLRNVVISGFSRGRVLASAVKSRCKGINAFQRETWDFDGVGGPIPGAPRVIGYDQQKVKTPTGSFQFHVPPERWVKYHSAVVANVHGDIPAMMARHAAEVSSVGK